jgi:hypothetical protein
MVGHYAPTACSQQGQERVLACGQPHFHIFNQGSAALKVDFD